MKLTPQQEAQRQQINFHREALAILMLEHACVVVQRRAPHAEVPVHSGDGDYGTGVCAICGRGTGWYCPNSPTHECSYDHNGICTHCGQPDERK